MFISKIHLFNWLSHTDTTIDLEALTAFRGENGAGKSSIESGLNFTFTGRCVATDDKGSGGKDLIRRGNDKAAITLDLTHDKRPIRMRCSITEKSGRTVQIKDPSDASWTGSEFTNMLAANREVLDCLINGRYFTEMELARQQKLLAAIILPQSYEFEKWAVKAMADCHIGIDWLLKPVEVINQAYAKAFDERKLVNRLIKEWKEPPEISGELPDVDAIHARLADRQSQRNELDGKRRAVILAFEQSKTKHAGLKERGINLQARLTENLNRKREVGADVLSKAALKEKTTTAARVKDAVALDAEIAKIQGSMAELAKSLKQFDALGEAATCPTCTQPIAEEHFNKAVSALIERKDAAATKERELQDKRKALGDPEGAQKKIDAHATAEKNMKLVQTHIDEVERDIQECKAQMEALGTVKEDAQPDTAALDAQLADMDTRIAKGTAALADAVKLHADKAAYEEAIAAKKKLDAKHAELEKLLEYFGPSPAGVQAKLLSETVGAFEGRMNQVLAGWGFRCSLHFEPYAFLVGLVNSNEMFALRTMSDGQRAMFAAAFQVALAKTTGFNFVCVDEAEVFSDQNRVTLFKNLMGAGLDQAIVIAADQRRAIPNRPNTAFYMLSLDGSGVVPTSKVERLKYAPEQ